MKQLTLSIKRKYFDLIVSGEKKEEFREIRPNNSEKYVTFRLGGKEYRKWSELPENDEEVEILPVEYDTIKFLTGAYSGKRPYAVVEVVRAGWIIDEDEDGNRLTFEKDGITYYVMYIGYELGRVLEVNMNPL